MTCQADKPPACKIKKNKTNKPNQNKKTKPQTKKPYPNHWNTHNPVTDEKYKLISVSTYLP